MMKCIKEVTNSLIISNLIFMTQESTSKSNYQMYLNYLVELMKKTKGRELEMEYKHIIFDLDGTLIDTEESVLNTWRFTLGEYNYDYSLEDLRTVLGVTTRKALEQLNVKVDEKFEKRWIRNYRNFAGDATFFNGVKDMLMVLRGQGYSLGIVTSRCKDEYNDYFHSFNLESLFDLIVCADDTEKHKPNPEPLYKYTQLAKTELDSCIYIGDMLTDIECANRAGVASGLVAWNNSGVFCKEVDFIFSSPEKLLDNFL